MQKRDYVHKYAVKTNSQSLFQEYRTLRNQVTTSLQKAKREYFTHKIQNSNGKPKQLWELLNFAQNKTKTLSIPTNTSVNEFNQYFTSVGSKMIDRFSDQYPEWNWPDCIYTFTLPPISSDYVCRKLKHLSTESKMDNLQIDAKLLQLSSNIRSDHLTCIINLSYLTGKIPCEWKQAMVSPIYKGKGPRSDPGNYRPISIIPFIAKIMEKHVQNQLMKYFIEHSFVSHEQSAFLKARSTQISLHRVLDHFFENIDNSELTVVTFFDIKKCFDSIPHHVLLYKLGKYGIKNSEIEWFRNYLQGRTQIVNLNGQLSEKLLINAGIPQGSNLGPLLFLTYINDLNKNLNNECHV